MSVARSVAMIDWRHPWWLDDDEDDDEDERTPGD